MGRDAPPDLSTLQAALSDRPFAQLVGCGLIVVVALVILAATLLFVSGGSRALRDRVDVTVDVPDAVGLPKGAVVAVAGVSVGEVTDLSVHGAMARVSLALDPSAGLRRDASVRIRARSVLGEKYVELTPTSDSAPLLVDGDQLASGPDQTEIDEIVDALGPLVAAIDAEALGESFRAVTELLREDPERLERMLENADRALQNGADASEDLAGTLHQARSVLGRANTTLDGLDARVAHAGRVLEHADRLLTELDAAAEPLPETVAKANAALDEARAAIRPLAGASEDLARVLETLEGFDEDTIRRLLREEGVRVRLFGSGTRKIKENR